MYVPLFPACEQFKFKNAEISLIIFVRTEQQLWFKRTRIWKIQTSLTKWLQFLSKITPKSRRREKAINIFVAWAIPNNFLSILSFVYKVRSIDSLAYMQETHTKTWYFHCISLTKILSCIKTSIKPFLLKPSLIISLFSNT